MLSYLQNNLKQQFIHFFNPSIEYSIYFAKKDNKRKLCIAY